MRTSIRTALLWIAAPAALSAQGAPASSPAPNTSAEWALTASIVAGQRRESGAQENGSRLVGGAALVSPSNAVGTLKARELSLGFSQANTTVAGATVRENAIEIGAMADMVAMSSGMWRLDGGLGAVLSRSLGCTTGGSSAQRAGSVPCKYSFATDGTTRIGARGRVTSSWSGPITSVFLGADLTANTVSAGSGIAMGLFIGARYSLGTFSR